MDAEEILQQLHAIATADVTGLLQIRDGQLTVSDTAGLSPSLRAAIAAIEKTAGGIKVKFYDKLKALELLGKCTGLFDGSLQPPGESPLLEALLTATGEVMQTHDIPEAEQAAAAGDDLVESTGL